MKFTCGSTLLRLFFAEKKYCCLDVKTFQMITV